MKKRIMRYLMALALCLTLLSAAAQAADEHTHFLCGGDSCTEVGSHYDTEKIPFTAWRDSTKLPTTQGYYYLTDDVVLDGSNHIPWMPANNTVLCLNGHKITMKGDTNVITVNKDVNFFLTDCKGEGSVYGQITHATGKTGGVLVSSGGKFYMFGGSITKNKTSSGRVGGGVYVLGAFNLYGGEITDNEASEGGGVYAAGSGMFTMSGGSITGNKANSGNGGNGGGVYMGGSSTFTLSGGAKITGNMADYGGGVFAKESGKFTMTGGEISGNTAKYNGGGVHRAAGVNGTFTMSGGAKITGNGANYGGGVYANSTGAVDMNGGEISGNTANYGGGVCVEKGAFTMSGGAKIANNTATSTGGGVDVRVSGTFTMNGGEITGNGASEGGGVLVDGTINMSGGEITGNTATSTGGGVYAYGAFTVSGSVTVLENTKGGTANNVYLASGKFITIGDGGGLGDGARIGVTTANVPDEDGITIATNARSGDEKRFVSDAGDPYQTDFDNGTVVLKASAPITPPTGHTHCLCGESHKLIGDHETDTQTDFIPWSNKTGLPGAAGNYYLTEDVTLAITWAPVSGTVLCLNGHSITAKGDFNAIKVADGAVFTLTDCKGEGSTYGQITHASGAYGRGVEVENGTFNLYKGEISGNGGYGITGEKSHLGGGVQVTTGTFNMYGGSISGNTGGGYCVGGVYVADPRGTFNLYGGEISGNWAPFGGGVEVYGTFNMSGGEITNNRATYGGGVEVRGSTAAFNMSGGSITNNTAGSGNIGGGVYVHDGTFTVSGSATVTDNTANNVYLNNGKTIAIGEGGLSGKIGVTTATEPTEGKPVTVIAATKGISGLSTHVVSDNAAYVTAVEDSAIVLQVVGDGGETPQPVLVTKITLDTTTATLKVGETKTLTATVKPDNAASKDVIWTSSKPDVATVENGKVTAVNAGKATITVKATDGSNVSASCTVTVTADTTSGGGTTGGSTGGSTGGNTGGSSSGGGGGSSSDRDSSDSNPITKTETKNNPDGSTTKTETRRDGSVTQTTTGKDGAVSKTETKKDGSSVTESKTPDGSTGTVKTDKNGQTEAAAKLSDKAIEDAKKNGEAVKAPVEVEASRNPSSAPTVKVELPKGAGESKVEIPVSNVKSGTVAVLVHPDGTEEILKNSIPTEDGIRLTMDGSATVKIVDNAKGFIDIRDHWAEDDIDFVSARGLVNGVSDTIYAPNNSTTRAQLWTILARQNDADLSGGANWYEKAQLWSKDKGISDGTDPNAAINRAQMVTMLWRAAGQPAAGSTASFIDVPADAYYTGAVSWAVENGITTGVGGGRFDPAGACTRAQIAAFLARLYAEK